MNIQSVYLGEVDVSDESILTFPHGLPGFTDEKHFVLIDLPDNPAFHIFQSTENAELAFIVANPYLFFKTYEFDLDDASVDQLDIASEADVSVFVILTLQKPFEKTTANLQAPVIINRSAKKGKQIILNTSEYTTKHAIAPSASDEKEADSHARTQSETE
ncbi:flagellar assembly protein FliW [Thalassobacillus sp. CUG 92003]|uniref:flagellar assembly protein FliW n=1 Tax=Thalassobacillus sp. CUG 92003 TaxID=2736641 RepID=UPI0015E7986E|nr:flagellar assembly protein FliW [Thalassobacillus sp. CUG 92003]